MTSLSLPIPAEDFSSDATAMAPVPSLSVIVVAVYDVQHLTRCLRSLMQQVDPPAMEVIVVHPSAMATHELRQQFAGVRFVSSGRVSTQAEMIALGVSEATGDVVGLTVDHCTVDAKWCARLVAAHRGPYAAVGGPLEKGDQADTAVNWAVHFYDYCSYGYYQHPVPLGPARELSDCNVSYKRDVLAAMNDKWSTSFNVPLVNRELLASGQTLWFSPDLLVYQHRSIDCSRAARVAYRRGRAFASVRVTTFTLIERVVGIVVSPLLPARLMAKLVMNMARRQAHLGAFARAFPFVALFSASWAWGEFLGLLLGRPDYRVSVTDE